MKAVPKMNNNVSNMLESTMAKLREMVDVNSVVGDPIVVDSDVTIIPISRITAGYAGGGSDFVPKNASSHGNPYGGGVGAGLNVTPIAFLIIKEGNVRMLPVALPANTTADRLVEMIPETLDKIVEFIDSKLKKEKQVEE